VSAQEISVGAAVQQAPIYVGDRFVYGIIIDGTDQPGQPDLTPLQPWNPQFLANSNESQTSVTIINGRRSDNSIKRLVMKYHLTATEQGEFILPAISVVLDGKTYKTNSVRVTAAKPDVTDQMAFDVQLSETQCYVGQPITVTIACYYGTSDTRNLSFNIPFLSDSRFHVRNLDTPPGSGGQVGTLDLGPETVTARQTDASFQGRRYNAILFAKQIVPRQPGEFSFAAPVVACDIAVGSRGFFDRNYRRFAASAKPLSLNVLPLPQQDKPASFTGLVGRYQIKTAAEPAEVNVGDPITLTVTITGEQADLAELPDLAAMPAFAANFKIAADMAPPQTAAHRKDFTVSLRAAHDKVTEIPAIALSFFDVDQGRYVTVASDSVPLKVSPTQIVTSADAVGVDPVSTARAKELQLIKQGMAANYTGPELLIAEECDPRAALYRPVWFIVFIVPVAGFLVVLLIRFAFNHSPARFQARRRANALSTARKALRRLNPADKVFPDALGDLCRSFIADKYSKSALSLTPDDCRDILLQNHHDPQLVSEFCQILEAAQAARFGGQSAADALNRDRLERLLTRLDQ